MLLRSSLRPALQGRGQLMTRSVARHMATVSSIPEIKRREVRCLDIATFTQGNAQDKEQFCAQLSHALRYTGFTKLRNHGIATSDIDKVFDWVSERVDSPIYKSMLTDVRKNKRFFDLPLEAKNKAAHPKQPNPHRGYSYVGQEILSNVKDFEKGEMDAVAVHDIKVFSPFFPLSPPPSTSYDTLFIFLFSFFQMTKMPPMCRNPTIKARSRTSCTPTAGQTKRTFPDSVPLWKTSSTNATMFI